MPSASQADFASGGGEAGFSHGTAGFGGSTQSYQELSLDTREDAATSHNLPPISQSSQYTRQSGLPRQPQPQPQRVGSAPLSGMAAERDSTVGPDSLANLSLANPSRAGLPIATPPERNPQQQGIAKQLAEKVRSQAERLQKLEQYRSLCEQRIAELAPGHPIPVRLEHLGHGGGASSSADLQSVNAQLEARVRELEAGAGLEGTLGRSTQQRLEEALHDKKEAEQALLKETLENEELKRYVAVIKEALSAKVEDLGFADVLRQAVRKKAGGGRAKVGEKELDLFVELARLKQHVESLKRDKARADTRSQELEERVARLQEAEGRQRAGASQWQQRAEEQAAVMGKLEEEKNALLEFVEENVEKREQEAEQMVRLQQEKAAREGALAELQQRAGELGEREKQAHAKSKALERENDSLQGQVASLNEQVRKADEKVLSAEAQLAALRAEVQTHSKDLNTARSTLEQREGELARAREQQSRERETLEKKLALSEQRAQEQEQYQEEQEATSHEELGQLRKRLRGAEQKYSEAREALIRAEEEAFRRKDELERIVAERVLLQQSKERLEETLGHVQAELATERTRSQRLAGVEQKYETAVSQLKALEHQKYELSQRLGLLQDDFGETKEQLRAARGEVEKAERVAAETERSRADLVQVREALLGKQKAHNEILQQLGRLRREMAAKDEQIEAMGGEVRVYKQEVQHFAQLDRRADRLAADYEHSKQELRHYEQTMGHLNEQLQGVRSQLDGTQHESSRLVRENDLLRDRVRDLEALLRQRASPAPASPLRPDAPPAGPGAAAAGARYSPLRQFPAHQRGSSGFRGSGELLAGVNACLEAIREFIGKTRAQVRGTEELSEGFKQLVERTHEKLTRRIIDHAELEEAIFRVDEWLQGSLQEFERLLAHFPTKDLPAPRETRCLPYHNNNNGDSSLNDRASALTRRNDRLSKRLSRRGSFEDPRVEPAAGAEAAAAAGALVELRKEKEELERWVGRIVEAIPSPQLRSVSAALLDTLKSVRALGADKTRLESKLMNTESLYRLQIRKERAGSASEEGTQLRKQVETLRESFQNCKEQIALTEKRMRAQEEELAQVGDTEKRRTHLSLETDKQVVRLKLELQDLRAQMSELLQGKEGAERLNLKMSEERKLLDRELLLLRSQLATSGRSTSPAAGGGGHNPVPSFGGSTPSHFNKGEFGDFLPSRGQLPRGREDTQAVPSARGGAHYHSISDSSRGHSHSPAAERMQRVLDDSKRTLSYFSPNYPQRFEPKTRFPTLGAEGPDLDPRYSQQQ